MRPAKNPLTYLLVLLLLGFAPAPVPRAIQTYLGAEFGETDNILTVEGVFLSSPAVAAGLRVGDVVLSAEGIALRSRRDLTTLLVKKKPDDLLKLLIRREGREMTLTLKLAAARSYPYLGTIQSENTVNSVVKGSPADLAGLKPKDVLVSLDDTPISTSADLMAFLRSKSPGEVIRVELRRNEVPMKLKLTLGHRPGF